VTTNGTGRGRGRGKGVETDQQLGLADEPVAVEVGHLIKDWHELDLQGHNARAILKGIGEAKTKALDALPGDDGAKHRYTWIDEDGEEPVQYVVNTTPATEAKDIEFTRVPKRRATVDKQEAPRG
jgi:hypothetical protein